MRKHALLVASALIAAIAAQAFIAIAETWSFGPSLRPLNLVFGSATFPVVTAVSLGIPIGALYFALARLLQATSPLQLLVLLAPFAGLQLLGLLSSSVNAYSFFYAFVYVVPAVSGAVLWQRQAPRK